jgi:hypothetical protein
MPRTIQEILDHADELSKRFEEYPLERAALARARSERQSLDAVVAARAASIPNYR